MINVLLFLILFAILFPRSLKFLLALIFIGGVMLLGEVHANEAAHKIIPGKLGAMCKPQHVAETDALVASGRAGAGFRPQPKAPKMALSKP